MIALPAFALVLGLVPLAIPVSVPRDRPSLSVKDRQAVVDAAARSLAEGYVYEDSGRAYGVRLRERLRSGRYDTLATRADFARALTRDLQEMSADRHLRILPDSATGAEGPRMMRTPVGGGAPAGGMPGGGMVPGGGPGPHRRMGGRVSPNDGFARIAVLDGNVGYVDMRGFHGTDAGKARVDSAMKAFEGVRAIVIDLGRNKGGDGFMVQHLSSYFFDKPTHLVTRSMRGEETPMETWTLESVPGPRHARTPLYVLTSDTTFSAAESFAFGLKSVGRATIVGRPTGGGGHFGRVDPLVEGFSIWLPHGRTFDPRTGKGWQGTGVQPDVAVPYDDALNKALELARAR